jgi:hypothetical protein
VSKNFNSCSEQYFVFQLNDIGKIKKNPLADVATLSNNEMREVFRCIFPAESIVYLKTILAIIAFAYFGSEQCKNLWKEAPWALGNRPRDILDSDDPIADLKFCNIDTI